MKDLGTDGITIKLSKKLGHRAWIVFIMLRIDISGWFL